MKHISDSQLNEYLDHALPAGMVRITDSHLESCDSCRARLEEMQLLFNLLGDLPEIRIPHDLAPNILSRLPQRNTHLWTPVFAAQAGAALGILLWFSTMVVRLNKIPMISNFIIPKFTIPEVASLIPTFNLLSLTINFLLTFPKIQFLSTNPEENLLDNLGLVHTSFWFNHLPVWQIPISNFSLAGITISGLLLCLLVNAALLRQPSSEKK
jgi:hypothetical protein